jgi:hypothetical protein
VEVVGTDLTTTVGPDGQFALRGIPPRTVELRFTGTGTNAKVTIRDVVANEQIVVRISVHGSTAVIESETRGNSDHTRAEVNGVIDSLTGTPAAFEFKVGSRVVRGDAQTTFFGDGNRSDSFDDLKNGARVEVKGQQRDGFVYAERIHVNGGNGDGDDGDDDGDDNDDANEFETDGAVSGLNGSCPTLAFSVNGASIFTDGSTTFKHGPCSQLGNGDRVEVRGTQQADGRVRASKVDRENK